MLCKLCSSDPLIQQEVWYAYQEHKNYEGPLTKARELGVETNFEEVKQHFKHHNILQPPPKGYLRKDEALAKALKLPLRLQNILKLVAKVPALSGTQLAEMFYWNGTPGQLTAARNACYRDLKRLVQDDYLYRFYPNFSANASDTQRSKERLSIYFLGRNATPLVANAKIEVGKKDWIGHPRQLESSHLVLQKNDASQVVSMLSRQMKSAESLAIHANFQNVEFKFSMNPENWFGPFQTQTRFHAPTGSTLLRPDGLAAVGLEAVGKPMQLLAPFYYEYDDTTRTPYSSANRLLAFVEYYRSGEFSKQFDLPGFFPPILIVCKDAQRSQALTRAAKTAARKQGMVDRLPLMIITDKQTAERHALLGSCWRSVWGDEKKYTLIEALLRSSRPLAGKFSKDAVIVRQ